MNGMSHNDTSATLPLTNWTSVETDSSIEYCIRKIVKLLIETCEMWQR